MKHNQRMADASAKYYFDTKKRIEEMRAEREELWQKNKTEQSAQIFSETMNIIAKIEAAQSDLNNYACLVVEYLYGEKENEIQQKQE